MKNHAAIAAVSGAVLWGLAVVQPVFAEMPPAEYAGREYIDSQGCIFQRVVFNGAVGWVALLAADGTQVCTPLQPASEPAAANEATDEGAAQEEPTKPATLPNGYWVQIGAFARVANAEAQAKALKEMGYSVVTVPVKKGRFIAVLAGPFDDRAATATALGKLRARYPEAFARP